MGANNIQLRDFSMEKPSLLSNVEILLNEPCVSKLIQEQKSKFDPFRTLGIEHYELRHTTVLSWLLNPEESHGLGEGFVRAFLDELEISDDFKVVPGRLQVIAEVPLVKGTAEINSWRFGYRDTSRREVMLDIEEDNEEEKSGRKRLDILIDGGNWCIAIEAKVRAKAGKDQLPSYYSATHAYAAGRNFRCFFLTLHGDPHEEWDAILWAQHVARPLRAVLSKPGVRSEQISLFLNQYVQLIERLSGVASDQLGAELRRISWDESIRPLIKNAAAEVSQFLTAGGFSPLFLRHRWLLSQLFQNIPGERARLAQQVLAELDPKGVATQSAAVSKQGSVSFLPISWDSDLAYRNEQPVVVYHIEVKEAVLKRGPGKDRQRAVRDDKYYQQDVEIKVWLHPAGPKEIQNRLFEAIKNSKQASLTAKGKFLRSAKLFTKTFNYAICPEGHFKIEDSAWDSFRDNFADIAESQWNCLASILNEA